jgi:hypothetical protein
LVLLQQGAALEGPADPGSGYMARPEWYSLPLYQLRMLFEGPLEIVATMVLPGLLAGVLVARLSSIGRRGAARSALAGAGGDGDRSRRHRRPGGGQPC